MNVPGLWRSGRCAALAIARDEIEREGVYLHFARLKLQADRFAEARANLNAVTNDMYVALKQRLVRNLEEQEKKGAGNQRAAGLEQRGVRFDGARPPPPAATRRL